MSKLISVAGYSFKDGSFKFRTANDIKRASQLEALGDTLVNMITLPKPMTKAEAAKHLLTINFSKGKAEVDALFTANAVDENPFAKPAKVAKKPATVKVTKKVVPAPQIQMDVIGFNSVKASKIRAEFMKKLKVVYDAA